MQPVQRLSSGTSFQNIFTPLLIVNECVISRPWWKRTMGIVLSTPNTLHNPKIASFRLTHWMFFLCTALFCYVVLSFHWDKKRGSTWTHDTRLCHLSAYRRCSGSGLCLFDDFHLKAHNLCFRLLSFVKWIKLTKIWDASITFRINICTYGCVFGHRAATKESFWVGV